MSISDVATVAGMMACCFLTQLLFQMALHAGGPFTAQRSR